MPGSEHSRSILLGILVPLMVAAAPLACRHAPTPDPDLVALHAGVLSDSALAKVVTDSFWVDLGGHDAAYPYRYEPGHWLVEYTWFFLPERPIRLLTYDQMSHLEAGGGIDDSTIVSLVSYRTDLQAADTVALHQRARELRPKTPPSQLIPAIEAAALQSRRMREPPPTLSFGLRNWPFAKSAQESLQLSRIPEGEPLISQEGKFLWTSTTSGTAYEYKGIRFIGQLGVRDVDVIKALVEPQLHPQEAITQMAWDPGLTQLIVHTLFDAPDWARARKRNPQHFPGLGGGGRNFDLRWMGERWEILNVTTWIS